MSQMARQTDEQKTLMIYKTVKKWANFLQIVKIVAILASM